MSRHFCPQTKKETNNIDINYCSNFYLSDTVEYFHMDTSIMVIISVFEHANIISWFQTAEYAPLKTGTL